ncbi:5114_t:CDS:2 [Acaulospora morrowiae]|uniref:5114_t:CDS:1 n=1 Tax=Acaulospora morrowiae TaxID=94023 RepID=A0A9N9AXR6_9GLOM|nr:5114_t:CDS:2 [Acaulospora morrowiae]
MGMRNKGRKGNKHHAMKERRVHVDSENSDDEQTGSGGDNDISRNDPLSNVNSGSSENVVNEIKQLKAKFYESDIEREGLRSLTESLKTKVSQLQQQILKYESSSQENDALRSQKESLEEKVEKLQLKVREYEKTIQEFRSDLESVNQQNIEYSRSRIELEKKNNLLESELRRLQTKVNESDKEVDDQKYEIERLLDRINSLKQSKAEMKDLHEIVDVEYRRLQCRNVENELEIETLQLEVKRLRDKCVMMRQESDETVRSHDKLKFDMKALQHVIVEQDRIIRTKGQKESCVHPAYCNVCNKLIVGIRYKCGHCDNYDICVNCEGSNHDRTHVFIKIKYPIDNDRFADTALLPKFRLIEQYENDVDHKAVCDVCHKNIMGIRHKCGHCAEFEMCVSCEAYPYNIHDPTHVFIKIKRPVCIDSKEPLLPRDFHPSTKQQY